LGYTVRELLEKVDSSELTEWMMLAQIEAEEAEARTLEYKASQGAAKRRQNVTDRVS
jgi:hypothetical protein